MKAATESFLDWCGRTHVALVVSPQPLAANACCHALERSSTARIATELRASKVITFEQAEINTGRKGIS